MGFSIIFRRAASSASSLALRSAQNIKVFNVHDHGRISQELYARKKDSLSCRYISSDSKKTSVEETKELSAEQQRIIEAKLIKSEATKKASVENTTKRSLEDTKKLSAEDQGILEIVEANLKAAQETMHTINEIDGFPFTVEDPKELLVLMRRVYENEEICVKISNYTFISGSIPMSVEVCKEGRLSLMFHVYALHKGILITSFSIGTKDSQGQIYYEEPPLNIDSKLQEAFLNYLNVRGINTTVFKILREHMNQKRDSLVWMENLKKFIEI